MNPKTEARAFEFRASDSGVLEGIALPYGVGSRIDTFTETFEPRSLILSPAIHVNVEHDQGRIIASLGNGLTLTDTDEGMRAQVALPDSDYGREIRAKVDAGDIRGMSVEFAPIRERWDGMDSRIIEQAELRGLAVCRNPLHRSALIAEVRAKSARRRRVWLLP